MSTFHRCVYSTLRILSIGFFLLLNAQVFADAVTITSIADTTLSELTSDNNFGANEAVFAGITGPSGSNTERIGLFLFDIAGSVPTGATIDAASLTLSVTLAPSGSSDEFELSRMLVDWGEGTGTGNSGTFANAGEATWSFAFYDTVSWPAMRAAAPSASQTVSSEGDYTWASAGLASDVQLWLDTPAQNFGWQLVYSGNGAFNAKQFASRESRFFPKPALVIEYTLAAVENADFDEDGDIDGSDFLIWQAGFGSAGGPGSGDANGDNSVNADDLAIWKSQYGGNSGASLGVGASVPEPKSLVLTLLVGFGYIHTCRRRKLKSS